MPVGSILNGIIGAGGAQAAGAAAGQAGADALQRATDLANKDRAVLSPWVGAGMGAEKELAALYGLGRLDPIGDQYNTYGLYQDDREGEQANALARFKTSPGYTFRLQEGVNALNRSASAKGMNLSGAQAKALTDYGQNTASNEWGNYVNGLSGLAGGGMNAGIASNSAANQAMLPGIQNAFQGDMSRASSYSNAANALAGGISSGLNNLISLGGRMGAFGGGGWNGTYGDGSQIAGGRI